MNGRPLIGVTGSSRTTVGTVQATELDCWFYGPNYDHRAANKDAPGILLADENRKLWLQTLVGVIDILIHQISTTYCGQRKSSCSP